MEKRHIVYWVLAAIVDVLVYIFLGLLLMHYDDNYKESDGGYMSLQNMNGFDLGVYVAMNIWHLVNLAGITWVVIKVYKKIRLRRRLF